MKLLVLAILYFSVMSCIKKESGFRLPPPLRLDNDSVVQLISIWPRNYPGTDTSNNHVSSFFFSSSVTGNKNVEWLPVAGFSEHVAGSYTIHYLGPANVYFGFVDSSYLTVNAFGFTTSSLKGKPLFEVKNDSGYSKILYGADKLRFHFQNLFNLDTLNTDQYGSLTNYYLNQKRGTRYRE